MVTLKGFLPSEPDRRLVNWLCEQAEKADRKSWKARPVYRVRVPEPGVMVRGDAVGKIWSLSVTATVQELCDAVFPTGWELQKDWPKLREALFRVNDYTVSARDSDPRSGGWDDRGGWRPLGLDGGPLFDAASADDLVVFSVTRERPPA